MLSDDIKTRPLLKHEQLNLLNVMYYGVSQIFIHKTPYLIVTRAVERLVI